MTEKKHHASLNVFLIKESISVVEKIIHENKCNSPLAIRVFGGGKGKLFLQKTPAKLPKWASIFEDEIDKNKIGKTSSVSAAFLMKIASRYFVLAFGPGGRFLIKDDVFEERFGLIVALNSVDKKTFRCIDKHSFDTMQSHTRIQSSEGTSPEHFGLDVEQDILRAIVGTPTDGNLGTRMTGMDSLCVTVRMELNDLPQLLTVYKKQYELDLNDTDYHWVNNIAQIGGPSTLIERLNSHLITKFVNDDRSNLWLSIPEIIQWDLIEGFMYDGGRGIIYPDINLKGFLDTVEDRTNISLETLKRRKVFCADSDHKRVYKQWSIYKCIYAEVDDEGKKYILTGGQWFCINNDFVSKINRSFKDIDRSSLELPDYKGGREGFYNKSVEELQPNQYLLMDDRKKIFHGGGSGQVEFCDLFSINKELIHIKKYGQSKVFSHLFSQGFVSGQLLQLDKEFRKKVVKKMSSPFSDLIKIDSRPEEQEYTIVFGIISDSEGDDIYLPFFSRVNLNNAAKTLKGFGYKVELLKIPFDSGYSKKRICPPGMKKVIQKI